MFRLSLVLIVAMTAAACTQPPAPASAPARTPAARKAAAAKAPVEESAVQAPAEPYVYQTEGRRDPFVSSLATTATTDTRPLPSKRGEGLAGLAVNEIAVRGLVLINGARVAMVQGPDGRNYNVHAGDKLMDGTVKSIVPEGLVIVQDVNDPLSTAKQREIRKLLRSLEEAKQ